MKKYVIYLLVAATTLAFSGCGYSEEEVSVLCSEQYELGYRSGEATGFDAGYDEGYTNGQKDGYDLGYEDGHNLGYEEGKSNGYLSGQADGYANGYQTGMDKDYEAPDDADIAYIGNKNSEVFHRPTCSNLPNTENRVYFSSREEAVDKGYRPCSNCDP